MKIVFAYKDNLPKAYLDLITNAIPKSFAVEMIPFSAPISAFEKILKTADIALFAPSGKNLPAAVFGRQLKLIQLLSSGYDKFNTAGAAAAGVPVANNGGANGPAVAEHTILLILALQRHLLENNERGRAGAGIGKQYGFDLETLAGKKVGIIGYGSVGSEVTKRLTGWDVEVITYDIKDSPNKKSLDELLATADIITLHLRASPETKHILNKKAFEKMKKGVLIINTARPELVEEEALADALANGKVAGAGLDVITDKKRPNPRLLQFPNCLITPHIAGATKNTYLLSIKRAVENFIAVERGEKPNWIINGVN
jgi:phosphoglycerate dehydrogenase-like enzyme